MQRIEGSFPHSDLPPSVHNTNRKMTILAFIIIAVVAVVMLARVYAERRARLLSAEIASLPDIMEGLEARFGSHIITSAEKNKFLVPYRDVYSRASGLGSTLDRLHVKTPDVMVQFVCFFDNIDGIVARHNRQVEKGILERESSYFDTCLKYPLNTQQRETIVAEEYNVLVVSSAGSGKTSSIVGKVKYLTEIKHVEPEKILLISYTRKAANELTERTGAKGLQGYTFHKLALDIIGKATGSKPGICDNTDSLFVAIYRKLVNDERFRDSILEYFVDFSDYDEEWEKRKKERQQQLAEIKSNTIKATFPDMDGNEVYVRSEQEKKICFALPLSA